MILTFQRTSMWLRVARGVVSFGAFLLCRMASVAEMACDGAGRRACQGCLQWGPDVHHGVKATLYLYWVKNKRCPFCRDGRCEFNALAEQYMLQKGEGCNVHSAISRMPSPHGTDLTRLFKCGGCCTHGRMPFENGICNQCHTALSITYDDVTIRHLFDAHLPGIVELRYRVLKDWTERCPIHKIAEQVKFRMSTRKYKEQLRMCLVPSSAFSYASCIARDTSYGPQSRPPRSRPEPPETEQHVKECSSPGGKVLHPLVAKCGLILEEQLSAQKKIMVELAWKSDFSGAAAAQEEVKKIEALGEKLHEKNAVVHESVARKDFAGAASAQEEINVIARRLMAVLPERLACEVVAVGAEATKPVEVTRLGSCDGGDVYQADSDDERNGDGKCDVESCRYGSSSEVMPNRAVDAESANQDNGCVVCMERPRNRLMWPCKHLCLCAECVEAATAKGTCPICIRKITEVVEVFLP